MLEMLLECDTVLFGALMLALRRCAKQGCLVLYFGPLILEWRGTTVLRKLENPTPNNTALYRNGLNHQKREQLLPHNDQIVAMLIQLKEMDSCEGVQV
jgi:hypothetical protein